MPVDHDTSGRQGARPSLRIHLVATLKNEGPYLVEWIAYYRAIGVTDFTLFSNDCSDGTNLMLDRLDAMGVVRHFDNPLGPRMDPQRRAYSRAGRMKAVREADWVLVVDADEFVHVAVGDGTLPALIEACGPADAISLGWRLMGSNGAQRWVDAPVTERFTRGGTVEPPENGMVPGFKTLFRPGKFDYFGVHRPKFDKKKRSALPDVVWRNASGKDIGEWTIRGGWRFVEDSAGYAYGWVNHYAVKSREEFLLKRLRGSANTKDEDRLDLSYWTTFDLNSLAPPPLPLEGMRAEADRLLADADLAALRRACIATARRVLDAQLENPEHAEFVEDADTPDAPVLEPAAQGTAVFADDADGKWRPETGHRFVLVATMRDEAPYLLEWIAWHRLIGVEHFVIYTNDCTDGTDAMLDRLQALGIVEHHANEIEANEPPHYRALRRAWQLQSVRTAHWVIHLDADEFLDITAGDGSLDAFLAACDPDTRAHAISLPWRYMGSHGLALPDDRPVTHRFLRGSRIVPRETQTALTFKSMFRPKAFRRPGIHRPKAKDRNGKLVWLNASGVDISEDFARENASDDRTMFMPRTVGFDHGSIRHYAIKSRAEYLLKRMRGSATLHHDRLSLDYFVRRNINSIALEPLGRETLASAISALCEDEALADLHAAALRERDARIAAMWDNASAVHFLKSGRTDRPEAAPGMSGAEPPITDHPQRRVEPGAAPWEATGARPKTEAGADPATEAAIDLPASPAPLFHARPRILCIATHHKTGTMWLRNTFQRVARQQNIPMRQIREFGHLKRLERPGTLIAVNWDADFPRLIHEIPEARILHMIRDPRDVLLSGMRYHLTAPTVREKFLTQKRPEWGGLTYQAYLNALESHVNRLLFEMRHKHRQTVDGMLAWEYGRANSIELRYEDLIADPTCAIFRGALKEADIEGLEIKGAVKAFRKNALFGGLADPAQRDDRIALHIRSGAAEQWKTQLPREVAEAYRAEFGEALMVLRYADSDDWVELCPTAAQIAERDAAESCA